MVEKFDFEFEDVVVIIFMYEVGMDVGKIFKSVKKVVCVVVVVVEEVNKEKKFGVIYMGCIFYGFYEYEIR